MSKGIFNTLQSLATGKQKEVDKLLSSDTTFTTATGDQALEKSLDQRVIRATSVAELTALSAANVADGQLAYVLKDGAYSWSASEAAWIRQDNVGIGITPSPTNMLIVQQSAADNPGIGSSVQVQRLANFEEGLVNPKAFRALTVIGPEITTQTEWAISGELEVNTDSSVLGHAAVSGVGIKNAKGQTFAGHFQVKDTTGLPSSTGGSIVGQELNIQANDVDDGLARVGYDIIARTYQPGFDAGQSAGEFHAAIRIRNSEQSVAGGKWIHGLLFEDGVQAISRAITTKNSPGTTTGWALRDEGAKANGISLTGDYGHAALDLSQQDISNNKDAIVLQPNAKIDLTGVGQSIDWANDIANPCLRLLGQNIQTAVGASGAGDPLPAAPKGYMRAHINGSDVLIAFWNPPA